MKNYSEEYEIKNIVKQALQEDIGSKDITTDSLIPADMTLKAVLLAKEDCVVCGLGVAGLVLKSMDKKIKFKPLVCEGRFVKKGTMVGWIQGKARSILSSERAALNFICLLSGIATRTREYVEAVKPYKVKILDTRKTIPGLRLLEKYAVRIGGGYNHRIRLDEMVMVKDNHIRAAAGIPGIAGHPGKIVRKIEEETRHSRKIEIEVNNLKEFKQALESSPDIIMLDNMSVREILIAVALRNKSAPDANHPLPLLEASGGISLSNIKAIAACGVDTISIGALTHSVSSIDISLEIL